MSKLPKGIDNITKPVYDLLMKKYKSLNEELSKKSTVFEIEQEIENVPQDMLNKLKVGDVLIAGGSIYFCKDHSPNYVSFMSFNFSDDEILSTSYAEYNRQSVEDNYKLDIFITEDTQLPITSGTKLYKHNITFYEGAGYTFGVVSTIQQQVSSVNSALKLISEGLSVNIINGDGEGYGFVACPQIEYGYPIIIVSNSSGTLSTIATSIFSEPFVDTVTEL